MKSFIENELQYFSAPYWPNPPVDTVQPLTEEGLAYVMEMAAVCGDPGDYGVVHLPWVLVHALLLRLKRAELDVCSHELRESK